MTPARREELKAKAREVAERFRLRELAGAHMPVSDADPDARESVTSSLRMFWPPGVLRIFQRAHVIHNPIRLYDEVWPDVVRPASPVKRSQNNSMTGAENR